MDMGFAQQALQSASAPAGNGHPDWTAMRARFGASLAMRAALAQADTNRDRAAGSFDERHANLLAAYAACFTAVNPVPSADGKRGGQKDEAFAGDCQTGGRG